MKEKGKRSAVAETQDWISASAKLSPVTDRSPSPEPSHSHCFKVIGWQYLCNPEIRGR